MSTTVTQLLAYAEQEGARSDLPVGLLEGLIDTESGWLPSATGYNRNSAGVVVSIDRGLAQINNKAQPQVSDAQAYDPRFSIAWAAQYLAKLLKGAGGDVQAALEEYNSGRPTGDAGYAQTVLTAARRYGYTGPTTAAGSGHATNASAAARGASSSKAVAAGAAAASPSAGNAGRTAALLAIAAALAVLLIGAAARS